MSEEEILNIPLQYQCHSSFEYKHTSTYSASYMGHSFGLCVHVPYENGEPRGRVYRHYMVDGKVFKTKKKFIEYCKNL